MSKTEGFAIDNGPSGHGAPEVRACKTEGFAIKHESGLLTAAGGHTSRLLIVLLSLAPSAAFAGGYELLGNGTVALGRGTAFTAKADDATAVEYNVAGLARQRGTRLLIDGKLNFNTYEFTRAGSYPVDATLAYSGQPYPKVGNTNGISFAPLVGRSTALGKLA